MAAGRRHGKIAVNLATELNLFARARRLGTVVASDSGVWLERDPDTVREPDVAYTSQRRSRSTRRSTVTPRSFPTWS